MVLNKPLTSPIATHSLIVSGFHALSDPIRISVIEIALVSKLKKHFYIVAVHSALHTSKVVKSGQANCSNLNFVCMIPMSFAC